MATRRTNFVTAYCLKLYSVCSREFSILPSPNS